MQEWTPFIHHPYEHSKVNQCKTQCRKWKIIDTLVVSLLAQNGYVMNYNGHRFRLWNTTANFTALECHEQHHKICQKPHEVVYVWTQSQTLHNLVWAPTSQVRYSSCEYLSGQTKCYLTKLLLTQIKKYTIALSNTIPIYHAPKISVWKKYSVCNRVRSYLAISLFSKIAPAILADDAYQSNCKIWSTKHSVNISL